MKFISNIIIKIEMQIDVQGIKKNFRTNQA